MFGLLGNIQSRTPKGKRLRHPETFPHLSRHEKGQFIVSAFSQAGLMLCKYVWLKAETTRHYVLLWSVRLRCEMSSDLHISHIPATFSLSGISPAVPLTPGSSVLACTHPHWLVGRLLTKRKHCEICLTSGNYAAAASSRLALVLAQIMENGNVDQEVVILNTLNCSQVIFNGLKMS